MAQNLQMITKYKPLKLNECSIEYSGDNNNILELNLDNDTIVEKNYTSYYTCQLFTLRQKTDHSVSIYFEKIIDRETVVSDFSEDLENIAILINENCISLRLYSGAGSDLAIDLKMHSDNTITISRIANVIPDYFLSLNDIYHIDVEQKLCFYKDYAASVRFEEIIIISKSGVLLKSESDYGHDLIWISAKAKVSRKEMHNAVLAASIDEDNNIFYISEQNAGLQQISLYDVNSLEKISSHHERYGTVTPFYHAGKTLLYVTGSIDGVYLQTVQGLIIKKIHDGLANYCHSFFSSDELKVTSTLPVDDSSHHILFFHGGPESCEWDNPRLPFFVKEFAKNNMSFHIINYTGSTNFGAIFRKKGDGDVINKTITPIIKWINSNLQECRIILFGGSFGGTLALELLCREAKIKASVVGTLLINPLLDLKQHIKRVLAYDGDSQFFKNKFGDNDHYLIEKNRYINEINYERCKVLLILGRRDEVLGFDGALEYLRLLDTLNLTGLFIDGGGHASLSHYIHREKRMIDFVKKHLL